jgi:phosphoglycerate dehydrogenase-like enzyme
MDKHNTLFITQRGERHQQAALNAAPPELQITMRRSPAREEIISLLPGMEFLISERTGQIDAGVIAAGKDLRLIQRLGSQVYDIDLEAAHKAGVAVCYWPVYTCVMVSEHMLMQMLALAKRLNEMQRIAVEAASWGQESKESDEDTFAFNWSGRKDIRGIYESTVGIVGLGEIGFELARRLKNFGCTVLYNKRNRLPEAAEVELNVVYAELPELLGRSDFVCMLLPFFPETKRIVNESFIAQMKAGACLVCCGGSGILDEEAVARALASGRLHGVATDTYAWEPIRPDNPLLQLAHSGDANIILTPHTAAGTIAAQRDERLEDYSNLLNLLNERPLKFRLV